MENHRMLGTEEAVVLGTEGGPGPTEVPNTTAAAEGAGGSGPHETGGNGPPMVRFAPTFGPRSGRRISGRPTHGHAESTLRGALPVTVVTGLGGSAYDDAMISATIPPWAPTAANVQAAVERLVAAAHPKQIILFGSRARGDADANSDVDLLIVKENVTNRYEELVELDRSLAGLTIPVDILLVSEAEFEERAAQPGTVEHVARDEGRVLYAA